MALHHPNYAVVARADTVYVFRNRNKQHFQVYTEEAQFTPLALFQNVGGAVLIAKEGNQLASFQLNIDSLTASRVKAIEFNDQIVSAHRSRSFVALQLADSKVAVIDPETLEVRVSFEGTAQDTQDDVFLNQRGEVLDLSTSSSWENLKAGNVCKSQKPKQSGQWSPEYTVPFVIECGMTLRIANDAQALYEVKSQHHDRGNVIRSFQASDNSEFLLVFQDLSLHYIAGGKRLWSLEQAISKVTQVEVFDQTQVAGFKRNAVEYVETMGEEMSIIDVPGRILARYVQNLEFLSNSIKSFFSSNDQSIAEQADVRGFNKLLILLT